MKNVKMIDFCPTATWDKIIVLGRRGEPIVITGQNMTF
jgi:hypothetical protein